MKKVIVRAPVRADLAGGTLDLWPLYLFHPGSRTVNVAISFYAESEVVETGDGAIDLHLTDQQYRQRYESMQELSADPKAALIYRLVEHFHLNGISITTRTDAPRGSGLGGSSALSITLVRALSQLAGTPIEGEDLIFLVRDLETRLLGVPAGIQDYYPPVFGGLASLRLEPGAPKRHPINIPVADLAAHMLLHYTGVAHFSGTNNWEMYKRQIDGKKKVQRGFAKIAQTSIDMEKALEAGDFKQAGAVLAKRVGKPQSADRRHLDAGDRRGDRRRARCRRVGRKSMRRGRWWVHRVSLPTREPRSDRGGALGTVPGRVLDAAPVAHGMMVRGGEDEQFVSSPGRPRTAASRRDGEVEQLYVHGDRGEYKPFILAEAVVTHIEGRSGTHHSVVALVRRADRGHRRPRAVASGASGRAEPARSPRRAGSGAPRQLEHPARDRPAERDGVGGVVPHVSRRERAAAHLSQRRVRDVLGCERDARGLRRALPRRGEPPVSR